MCHTSVKGLMQDSSVCLHFVDSGDALPRKALPSGKVTEAATGRVEWGRGIRLPWVPPQSPITNIMVPYS